MRIIGLIGGMSWESTVPYYRLINEFVKRELGGLHSARLILYSVDFHDIARCMDSADWQAVGDALAGAARSLQSAGAQALVLCTNTMHKVAPAIEAAVQIPLLHIVDATASELLRAGIGTIGLLGTRATMEQEFYRERLSARHGLRVLIPDRAEREQLQRIIFEELCLGRVLPASRTDLQRIMTALAAQGAEAIVLGCTELAMLVGPEHSTLPLFDTTSIHARCAAQWALR
ncbi:MAG: aspartate/glutamate racemase family protein [Steroidobacteraceae bacterium]